MSSVEEFIKKYHLLVDNSKSCDRILFIRSSIRTEEEAQLFMKKFGQKTSTIWRVHYGNYNPQRVVFRKAWVCRYSSIRSIGVQEKNCDAKLDILVKKINPYTTKNDTFLLKKPPLPCIIRMHFKHNHNCQEDLKYLKVPDEVKELFYGYFDNGYGVAKAIRLQQEHLQKVKTISSVHFIPTKRQAYYLYRMWHEQRSLTGILCDDNDIVSNEPWHVFDWDELISAIPRESPPVKTIKKLSPDSPVIICSTNDNSHLNNESSEIKKLVPVTKAGVTLHTSKPVTFTSRSLSTESSVLPTVYLLDGAVQTQHIANSSNHLNGSILTVMNSNSLLSLISPHLVSTPVSSALNPISSIVNLEGISSKHSTDSLVLLTKENSSKHELNAKVISKPTEYISEASKSNYLHQSKVLDLSNMETPCYFVPKYSKPVSESNVQDYMSQFNILSNRNSFLSGTSKQTDITEQIIQPVFKDIVISSTSLVNQNSIISSNEMEVPKKSDILNTQALSNLLNKQEVNCVQLPAMNTLQCTDGECSKTSDVTNTQIQITNTVHQSGAQICMKPSIQCNQDPIVNAVHVSELLTCQQSSDELIKIKEEPPDLLHTYNLEESENLDFSPTIVKISSLSTNESLTNEETIFMPSIKREKFDDGTAVDESSIDLSDTTREEDEDQQFLMSLLPELKQLPSALKNKLKSDIENLVSCTKILENGRKRRRL